MLAGEASEQWKPHVSEWRDEYPEVWSGEMPGEAEHKAVIRDLDAARSLITAPRAKLSESAHFLRGMLEHLTTEMDRQNTETDERLARTLPPSFASVIAKQRAERELSGI